MDVVKGHLMNIEWDIDDEFSAEQRRGSLEVLARMEFPISYRPTGLLDDEGVVEAARKWSDRAYPGFGEYFEELSEDSGTALVARGSMTVLVPVTDDENVIVEHALDSVNDDIDGGSEAVVELFINDVVA